MASLKTASDKELTKQLQELMSARAKAEAEFKDKQMAIQAEFDRRAVEAAAEALPDDVKAAVVAMKEK